MLLCFKHDVRQVDAAQAGVFQEQADEKALAEYREYNKTQKIESDFDRSVKKILGSQSDD